MYTILTEKTVESLFECFIINGKYRNRQHQQDYIQINGKNHNACFTHKRAKNVPKNNKQNSKIAT